MMASDEIEYRVGYDQGEHDYRHPSGVVFHAAHRDPEGWAEQTEDWQRGYDIAWFLDGAGLAEVPEYTWRDPRQA